MDDIIGTYHVAMAVVQAFKNNEDGFTIRAIDGTTFAEPNTYLVGGVIPSLVLFPGQSGEDVYRYIENWYAKVLRVTTDPIVGGWMNEGFLHIDLITVVRAESEALILGRTWNQVSVGSLDSNGNFIELEVAK